MDARSGVEYLMQQSLNAKNWLLFFKCLSYGTREMFDGSKVAGLIAFQKDVSILLDIPFLLADSKEVHSAEL